MKIVAIVPIKLNNRRLPGKNLMKFNNGKYMFSYIFNTLLKIEKINDTYVYCSDDSIKKILPKGVKFLKRDESLDSDSAKMNDILYNFAKTIKADVYVLSHVTSPFISEKSILEGINHIINDDYDSSFSGKSIQEFMWQNNRPLNYDLKMIPRSQDLPELIIETCGFYIFKRSLIIKHHRRIGNNPYIFRCVAIYKWHIRKET